LRAESVKQGSGGIHPDEPEYAAHIEDMCMESLHLYNRLLKNNVAPEIARAVLPQNMMTEWIWSGTLGAFGDMLKLRMDPHAQAESQIVAYKIYNIIFQHFPVSIDALIDNK
jgi:thymidylate synthase (FAD)